MIRYEQNNVIHILKKEEHNKFNVDYYPILKINKVELIIKETHKIYIIDSFSIEEKIMLSLKKSILKLKKQNWVYKFKAFKIL